MAERPIYCGPFGVSRALLGVVVLPSLRFIGALIERSGLRSARPSRGAGAKRLRRRPPSRGNPGYAT